MFSTELYAEALTKVPEKYLLVSLVARRSRQLIQGADPLVDPEDLKPIDIALKEVCAEMITIEPSETVTEEDLFAL